MSKNILVVGNLEQDIYLSRINGLSLINEKNRSYNQIAVGEELVAQDRQLISGGTASNVALPLSKWGEAVTVLSVTGRDCLLGQMAKDLDANNIATNLIFTSNQISTACNYRLYDRGTGRQSVIKYSSDWSKLSFHRLDLSEYQFDWAYVASAGGNFDFYDKVFRDLKGQGCKIMFNPGASELSNLSKCFGLFEDVDVLLVNRSEAEQITHDPTLDGAVVKLANFVNLAVITSSEDGVIVSDNKSIWRAGVYQKVASIDRNGVGDAFGAGFLYQYAKTASVAEAIRYASANASSVLGKIGGWTGALSGTEKLDTLEVRERSVL